MPTKYWMPENAPIVAVFVTMVPALEAVNAVLMPVLVPTTVVPPERTVSVSGWLPAAVGAPASTRKMKSSVVFAAAPRVATFVTWNS